MCAHVYVCVCRWKSLLYLLNARAVAVDAI